MACCHQTKDSQVMYSTLHTGHSSEALIRTCFITLHVVSLQLQTSESFTCMLYLSSQLIVIHKPQCILSATFKYLVYLNLNNANVKLFDSFPAVSKPVPFQ